MITVLIPTFNRPNLLKIALESVYKQTYINCIDKIVVSENGLNRGSEDVCDEYPNLNIEYIFQEVQLPVLSHLKWLMSREKDTYVAFLSDDDLWNTFHIELAIKVIKEFPNVTSYFSNFNYVNDEHKLRFDSYAGTKIYNILLSSINNYSLLRFLEADVLFLSFILTPFHFSSLVCKSNALAQAVNVFDEVHPTYADRALWPVLARYGAIIFNPLSTSLVRFHAGQDSHNYSSVDWRYQNQNGSLFILSLAEARGIDIKSHINNSFLKSNLQDRQELNDELERVFLNREYLKWYKGYEDILILDKQKFVLAKVENSYTYRILHKVMNLVKRIYNN